MVLSKEEQERIRLVYKKYRSLKRTAKELGCSPNTVKKYVKGYYKVKEQNIVRKCKSTDERLIGTYVGLWMGDGTQYRDNGYIIKICLDGRNKELLQFVRQVFKNLFGCISWKLTNSNNNSHYVKIHSKFVFNFINQYCTYSRYKTETVQLKQSVSLYSKEFLEGCFLGLMLSDGCLKRVLSFNVISQGLAQNMFDILRTFGYEPRTYIQKRHNPKWKNLIHTKLLRQESKQANKQLDNIVQKLEINKSFNEIKYPQNDPPRI